MGHSLYESDESLSESTNSRFGLDGFPHSPVWVGGSNNKNGSDPVYPGCGDAREDKESSDQEWKDHGDD